MERNGLLKEWDFHRIVTIAEIQLELSLTILSETLQFDETWFDWLFF